MERITQRIAVAAALVLALTALGVRALVPSAEDRAGPVALHGHAVAATWVEPECVVEGDDAARELVDWALGRFELAELRLPPRLVIRFHEELAECGGTAGRYHPDDPPVIDLCVRFDRWENLRKIMALHELGHAWAETQTDVEVRAAFLDVRELDTWVNRDVPTHLWGAEQAAEVISWALVEVPFEVVRFEDAEPAALSQAYEVLTGFPVPARRVDGTT